MNYTASHLSYQQTGYFSKIVLDYINADESLKPFYEFPFTLDGIQAAIKKRENFKTNRTVLVEELKKQYAGINIADPVQQNIDSLIASNTFTITTAHQPAIFTGTLFFVYKILHAVKLAHYLSVHLPQHHFVPVYYMGSEDADLDELGNIYLGNEKVMWDTNQKGAVGRMNPKGLEKIIARIEGEYSVLPFGKELAKLFKDCYLNSPDIQTGTLKLVNSLFGDYGVVVLIPDNQALKKIMEPVFEDDLLNQHPSSIVEDTIRFFPDKYKVQANPRAINLFYLKDDIRELIEFRNGLYEVRGTGRKFSKEEILTELKHYPDRFSPNVILRGLFQSTILPDIIFIGGGGETGYWLELKNLFKNYKVPYPVLIIRNSFLIIDNKVQEKIHKAGFSSHDFFKPVNQLLSEFVIKKSSNQLDLGKEVDSAENYYDNLKRIASSVDTTLVQHVEAMKTKALKEIRQLGKKLVRNEKRKFEDINRQIHDVKSALFPSGNLQERIENFIPYYAMCGKEFLEVIYRHSMSLEQEFVVLEEDR
jgi:bacillithiol synthase